jgi:hypothetical protein
MGNQKEFYFEEIIIKIWVHNTFPNSYSPQV